MKTLIQSQRDFFNSNQTKSIDFRITQLLKLRKLLQANEQILNEAIYADFQKSAFDTFMSAFEVAVKKFRVEDPNLATCDMGLLISKKQFGAVQSFLDEPVAFTGSAPSGSGYWMPPTVLMPKNAQSRSWREEVFGPVLAVLPFTDEAHALALANDSRYGLSTYLWTSHLARAHRLARSFQSGMVWVNTEISRNLSTPFGGMKDSGIGRSVNAALRQDARVQVWKKGVFLQPQLNAPTEDTK